MFGRCFVFSCAGRADKLSHEEVANVLENQNPCANLQCGDKLEYIGLTCVVTEPTCLSIQL